MALAKKVVSVMENSEEQTIQEQMVRIMDMVEMSAQQAASANRALEKTRTELNTKIAKPQRENQILKEAQREIHNDPCKRWTIMRLRMMLIGVR